MKTISGTYNHALDALRYVAMEKLKVNAGKYSIR
jgi:hypothetical protein